MPSDRAAGITYKIRKPTKPGFLIIDDALQPFLAHAQQLGRLVHRQNRFLECRGCRDASREQTHFRQDLEQEVTVGQTRKGIILVLISAIHSFQGCNREGRDRLILFVPDDKFNEFVGEDTMDTVCFVLLGVNAEKDEELVIGCKTASS